MIPGSVATRSFRLTKRDVTLLQKLQSHGLLTTTQVARLMFPGRDMRLVLRRLRRLRKFGVITRDGGLSGGPFVWQITEKGAKLLGSTLVYGHVNRNILEHEIGLSELRLQLTEAKLVSLWKPGFEMRQELQARSKGEKTEEALVPDAIFTGTGPKAVPTALELELVPKSMRRYERVFSEYAQKKGLQVLWYVVRSAAFGRKLMALWMETAGRSSTITFAFSLLDEVLGSPQAAALHTAERVHNLGDVYSPPRPKPMASTPNGNGPQAHAS